jgi:hypothetical protein
MIYPYYTIANFSIANVPHSSTLELYFLVKHTIIPLQFDTTTLHLPFKVLLHFLHL